MAYIFLDESGQFTKYNNEIFFVIGSFTVGDPNRTEKKFRSWQRSRFPKKMRFQPEIKFSNIIISDRLRLSTLKFISELDIRIRFTFLKKENIPDEFNHKGKIKSGHLYTQIIGDTLQLYLPNSDNEFRVFCDQRHLKGITRAQFKSILRTLLLPSLPANSAVQIEMLDSAKYANIQIADWVTGALASYLERKQLGQEYFEIIKNNIIGEGQELFKDYWEERYNKKPNRKD